MNRPARLQYLLAVVLSIGLAACGGGAQMIPAGETPVIRQGESLVVFMRPSGFGQAISASVFDVSAPEPKFIGIVNYGSKVAYAVKPGEHTFMVVSEAADFMQATVAAGRTYYALVTPRPGLWKARFSFRPVRQHELDGGEFAGWSSATQFVANSPETLNWAVRNAADVNSKRSQYWPEWSAKPDVQRASQTLNAEDGKPSALAAASPAIAAPAPMAPTSRAEPTGSGVEIMFWESIRASNDPADFRAYLEQYPQGKFAALARNRLAALGHTPAPPAPAKPAPASSAASAQISASAPSSRLPSQGDTWTYRLTEPKRTDGPKQRNYVVKVSAASPSGIVEQYSLDGGPTGEWTHKGERHVITLGKSVFAPYLLAFSDLPSAGNLGRLQIADSACGAAYVCQASGRIVNRETIRVAAGTFDTIRVEVQQNWRPVAMSGHQGGQHYGGRTLTVWYSPAAKRAIKFSSRSTFGHFGPIDADFDLELVAYRLQ
jgi:hypothetical protein